MRWTDSPQIAVTVNKAQLRATLRKNREKHAAVYAQAVTAWRAQALAKLDVLAEELAKGGTPDLAIGLYQPREYLEEYDRALAMLEWHQGDSLELDSESFSRLIEDQWEWTPTFRSVTASYVTQGA